MIPAWGCNPNSHPPEPDLPAAFEADCSTVINGMPVSAHMIWRNPRNCELQIREPASLSGAKVMWDGESLHLKYGILSQKINPSDLSEAAFAFGIVDAVNAFLSGQEFNPEYNGSDWQYKGVCSSGNFVIFLDSSAGGIKKVEIPGAELSADFQNFTLLEGEYSSREISLTNS